MVQAIIVCLYSFDKRFENCSFQNVDKRHGVYQKELTLWRRMIVITIPIQSCVHTINGQTCLHNSLEDASEFMENLDEMLHRSYTHSNVIQTTSI